MAIAVGSPAPDFALKDQNQKEVKLSDYKGKKNVVLVFYPTFGHIGSIATDHGAIDHVAQDVPHTVH